MTGSDAVNHEPPLLEIGEPLVRRLVDGQFPRWSRLPLTPFASGGTDNAIFRLGDGLVARLPRRESAAPQALREQTWLPRLASHLPLPIPTPMAAGSPGEGYPWAWTICPWLEGDNAATAGVDDLCQAAADLAAFLNAMGSIDATDGPAAGVENHGRGLSLRVLDRRVRTDIARLSGEIDGLAVLRVWDEALAAPPWGRPGAWIHGDLHPGNLLVKAGRIAAVLDFGLMGVGDPACDLIIAWSLLEAASREVFRQALRADAAMWARGRGWAVFNAVIALAFYLETNPELCAISRRMLSEALSCRSPR